MTELQQLQHQFQQFVLTGSSDINSSIVTTKDLNSDLRLGIYKDAYRLRLLESLRINFPGLYQYLGSEEFEKLCSAYIEAHPSSYRSIRWFGDFLADFIKHYYVGKHAYLSELADLEWKMTLSFDAADAPLMRVEDMAVIAPESWAGLQFSAHPSVQRMNYFWNVVPVWKAVIHDSELPELTRTEQACPWLMWRSPDYQVMFQSITEQEAWALDVMIQGLSFGELCEGLCTWFEPEEVGLQAATFLKTWIQNGLLIKDTSAP
ncbi:MAG: DNA-binding domain-containing protein [Legionella sp.]|jgi:hypothetical protein